MTCAYRPAGVDGTQWSQARRDWIAAAEHRGQTEQLRTAIALRLGLSFERLRRWARRNGWPGMQRHNGRAR